MASVVQPPPPPPFVGTPRAKEMLVDEQIQQTRRAVKWVDFGSGMLTLVIGVLLYLLCASVIEHWIIPGGWNTAGRVTLFGVMLVGIAWYSWRTFWPLFSRPINPAYAAQLIERSSPSLKNSLLNFLLLRNRRQQISQKVYQAIEQQAAQRLSEVSLDSVIDRSALLRLGYVLVAVVALCAMYRILSPKNLTTSMERVLLPWSNIAAPSRVEITDVTPGDTQVARGESLEVSAEVLGLSEGEPVLARYSTLDGQIVDREVMLSAASGTVRYQGRLPDRFSAGESGGVQQDFEYWIEAGDAKSPKYRVTVFSRPTLVVEKIRYQYPHYTGMPPREVEGTGDISALEGTRVSIYAIANHEIASANVDFLGDGRNDLPMSVDKMKADAQLTLGLQDDRRTPEYDSYVLQYKSSSGLTNSQPPKYSIDVTPDYAPEIRLLAPANEESKLVEQLDVPIDASFTVEVEARDPDFALRNVVLLGEVAGQQVLKHDLLKQEQSGKFVGRMTATPSQLKLKPGDVLEYWGAAVDNREPEPNIAQTERLRIRVVGPPQFGNQQGEGQQPQGGGQGEQSGESGQGENGEQGEGLAGGEGEQGQQGGEGQSGSGGQNGEGQSEGEKQGQGGQGSSQGENSDSQQGQGGEANQQPTGQSGSEGSQQGDGSQQGQQRSGGQQSEGAQQSGQQQNSGGQAAENSQDQAGEQSKVSTEGDDDGAAFERMSDHFAEKDAQSQGKQSQSEQGNSETAQGKSQNSTESQQGDGTGSPEDAEQGQAEEGQNQDQGIEGSQEDERSDGSGAEGQPSEQREKQQSDAQGGDQGEQDAPGGKMSTEQGEKGAGNNPGENEGSMDTDVGRKSRDKSDQGPDSEHNDQEAPGQANSQKESDSQGSAGGDQSGGGQEGAGQQADAEGTGTAGENTAADDGGGQAAEQGAGENSNQAGEQAESNSPTGESSETKPGEGSKQSNQQGSNSEGEQPSGAPGQDSEQPSGEAATGEQDSQKPQNSSPPNGNLGEQPPMGSGTGSNNMTPPPAGELEAGDEANLDYARKQTDLVLDRLDKQLKKQDIDKELLKKLGWTEDELRQFVERWKKLKAEAIETPGQETDSELDQALRSLGLNRERRMGFRSQVTKEKLRELQDSYRGQTPIEYADRVRAYIKGTATVPEENR